MALNSRSLAAAAKKKAQLAQSKVLSAKTELDAANSALKRALPKRDIPSIAEAAKRTVVAEEELVTAAEELEGVNHLLDDQLASGGGPAPGRRSGQGAKSVVPHLKQEQRT